MHTLQYNLRNLTGVPIFIKICLRSSSKMIVIQGNLALNGNRGIMKGGDLKCWKCCLNVLRENHFYNTKCKIFSYPILGSYGV